MSRPTALVVGATGASAYRLVEHLLADGWSVVGVCRQPPAVSPSPRLSFRRADLFDAANCAQALRDCVDVTHVFYTARAKHGESGTESIPENVAMLASALDAIVPVARALEHVHLVEGGKWYGLHLGAVPIPMREDGPRPAEPNFYHAQEDLLRERQRGQRWTWSASRPNIFCDFVPGRARNLPTVLGTYAAVLRELGAPLDFPGSERRWNAVMEVTDCTLHARAMHFMATDPRVANEAFNVANGDAFRWRDVWPRIAAHYGMRVGAVRRTSMAAFMRDQEDVWQAVVQRHALAPSNLADLAAFAYGDFVLGLDHDILSSTAKLHAAGFTETLDSPAMLLRQLAQYRDARILP